MRANQFFEQDERRLSGVNHTDDSGHPRWHLHHGQPLRLFAGRSRQTENEVEAEGREHRKRARGVDRERGQRRQDFFIEMDG
jgi:hypothetical protein